MSLRRVIESPPDKHPTETEHSRYYENRAPTAEAVIEPHHKGRRDGGADGRTAVEQGHSPAAFGLGKPFGDSLSCAGPVGRAERRLSHLALHPHAAPSLHQSRGWQRPRPLHQPRARLAGAAALADDRPVVHGLLPAARALAPPRRAHRAAADMGGDLRRLRRRGRGGSPVRGGRPLLPARAPGRDVPGLRLRLPAAPRAAPHPRRGPDEDDAQPRGRRAPALARAPLPELPPRPPPAPARALPPLPRRMVAQRGCLPRGRARAQHRPRPPAHERGVPPPARARGSPLSAAAASARPSAAKRLRRAVRGAAPSRLPACACRRAAWPSSTYVPTTARALPAEQVYRVNILWTLSTGP